MEGVSDPTKQNSEILSCQSSKNRKLSLTCSIILNDADKYEETTNPYTQKILQWSSLNLSL